MAKKMKAPKKVKRVAIKRKWSPPKLVNTKDLCIELAAMAGFMADPKRREKIYKAVRQLQLLDRLATDAGLLPVLTENRQ